MDGTYSKFARPTEARFRSGIPWLADARPRTHSTVLSVGACSHSGAEAAVAVAVFGATACSVARVFAVVAVSVAGAVVPSAVFSLHWPAVSPSADVPAPASAGAFAGPFAASLAASPGPAGISDPVLDFPYSAAPYGPHEANRSDGALV